MKLVPDSELWNVLDDTRFKSRFAKTADKFGLHNRESLSALDSIASQLIASGRLRTAQTIEEFVLGQKERTLGPENPDTLKTLLALVRIFNALREPVRANQLLHGLYNSFNRAYKKKWEPGTKAALTRIGKALPVFFEPSSAPALDLDLLTRDLGSNLLAVQADTVSALHRAGQTEAARRILDSVLHTAPGLLGRDRATLGNRLYRNSNVPVLTVGRKLQDALRFDSAQILGPDEPDTAIALSDISSSLRDFGAVHTNPARVKSFSLAKPKAERPKIEVSTRDRFVNVWLSSKEKGVIGKHDTLDPQHDFLLHLTIGRKLAINAVENPVPVPVDKLPPDPAGHWLELVAVSGDFLLKRTRYHMFLPSRGEAFVCPCTPNQQHTCRDSERRLDLSLPVASPTIEKLEKEGSRKGVRVAQLRIGVYFVKNLVQSLRLRARISKTAATGGRFGYSVRIDYSLTAPLFDVTSLAARTLNILTNDNGDESHKMVFNGDEKDPVSFDIDGHKVSPAVTAARKTLWATGIKPYGGALGTQKQYQNLYNANNGKSKTDFIADLRTMANFGYLLWVTLFGGRPEDRQSVRAHLTSSTIRPAVIQISRIEHTEFMFPWAMIYDIPLESAANHDLCKCLDSWGKASASLDHCPYEQDSGRVNVICPFGFWGFKHIIELPPSMQRRRSLPVTISRSDPAHPARVVMGISRELDSSVTTKHTKALRTFASFDLLPTDSLAEFKKALSKDQLEFVYFYCHGKRQDLPGSNASIPLLVVGEAKDFINPPDIVTWQDSDWSKDHWKQTSPLVFINGCHTAELTPELLVDFVDTFIGAYASGVVGTEIMLLQNPASEAAEKILSRLNARDRDGIYGSVGQAVREMRLHFLNKGSLLGLAYTPYCCADLKLAS
jgi:hypothetical protein